MGLFLEKNHLKMLGFFSSRLDWDSYIFSITKTTSKKIGALIFTIKFLSLEIAFYRYKALHGMLLSCLEWCS